MIAVLLLDFGGPENLEEVRPFLKNLFSDANIMPFPVGQEIFAHIIAKFRSPKVIRQYEKIGGASPLPKQSRSIASQLEGALKKAGLDIQVFVGMRYTKPFISSVVEEITKLQPRGLIVIPMFPHYSTATTLSVLIEFQKAIDRLKISIPTQIVEWWHEQPQFIAAWCYTLTKALEQFDSKIRSQVPILFTAHGLPESFVTERKDPYPRQIKECSEKIMTYLGGDNPAYIAYQSKVGPMEWLKPSTIEFVKELGKREVKNLVIAPISFITDHIETLYEIDQEIIPEGRHAGIEKIVRTEALYYTPYLQKTLEELVLKRLPRLL